MSVADVEIDNENEEAVAPKLRPRCVVDVGGGKYELQVIAAACRKFNSNYGDVVVLNLAGPHTSIKAVWAALVDSQVKADFKWYEVFDEDRILDSQKHRGKKLKVYRQKLAYNTWQLVAKSEEECVLCPAGEQALWRRLRQTDITTPVLRSWMPWIKHALEERSFYTKLPSYNCNVADVRVSTEIIDGCVSDGLKAKHITI